MPITKYTPPEEAADARSLRRCEERLARTEAMAHVGDWEWDVRTNRVRWSDEVYRVYGYEPGEVEPDYDLVLRAMHPSAKEQFLAAIDAALKGERAFEMDYAFIARDGTKRELHTIGSVIRDAAGRPLRMVGTIQDTTERNRTGEALRESEARFRVLFESAPDACLLADIATGRIIDVNPAGCRLLGRPREQVVGLHHTDIHPPEFLASHREAFGAHVRESLGNDGTRPFEGVVLNAAGEQVPVEILARRIDVDGRPVLYGVFRDLSRRKQAQERLQRSQALLNRAEEIASLGSWEWDLATNTVEWSDEVYRIYGLDPARVAPTYQTVLETVHPAFRAEFLGAIEAALGGGRPFDGQFAIVRPDGTVRFTHTKGEIVRDAAGRPLRMVGVVQDITERKRSETFIQDILETVDEGFLIIDRDYRILSANRAYATQAGRDLREIIGRKCHEISHGLAVHCFDAGEDCAVRRVFATGEAAAAVHTHHDANGDPIYVETKAFPMTDPTGQVSAAIEIVNNITERKKLEEQYRQAQKMEAVALLAGGVAHDFNNLLTAITGYGHMLSLKVDPAGPLRGYAEQILGAADRAANLVQSLMAFGRKQVISPVPVDLGDVVRGILKLLRRVIREDVELATELSPEPCTVFADPSQIEQVLMNLATNARDAMPAGGVLRIRTETVRIDEAFRRDHGFGQDGAWARLSVSDTGMGMDEKTRERIFEPFFTTKELGRGTGLGLASVYGIVKQSNGYITVESEPGRGTSFAILLPLCPDAQRPADAACERAPGTGTETVLLAEDDPVLRSLLRSILVEHGYAVIEAENGEEAVERFRQGADRIRLLILDVIMPKKNGREVHAAIAALRPGVKTLFMSGYSKDIVDASLVREGGCQLLTKPVTPPALLNKVRDILDAR